MYRYLENKFTEIEGLKENIFRNLKTFDPEILQNKVDEKTWSPVQILSHLIFSERASVLYLKKKIKAGDDLENAWISSRWRMYLLRKAFNGNRKFKAPEALANPENLTLQQAEEEWNRVRSDLRDFLQSYPQKYRRKAIFRHPVAGRITVEQMLEFFKIHMLHHKKQIEKILTTTI